MHSACRCFVSIQEDERQSAIYWRMSLSMVKLCTTREGRLVVSAGWGMPVMALTRMIDKKHMHGLVNINVICEKDVETGRSKKLQRTELELHKALLLVQNHISVMSICRLVTLFVSIYSSLDRNSDAVVQFKVLHRREVAEEHEVGSYCVLIDHR